MTPSTLHMTVRIIGLLLILALILSGGRTFKLIEKGLRRLWFGKSLKELMSKKTKKYKYSVTIKIVDNRTGNDADIYMESDKPESFSAIGKTIQASCDIMNMSKEDQRAVQRQIQQTVKEAFQAKNN